MADLQEVREKEQRGRVASVISDLTPSASPSGIGAESVDMSFFGAEAVVCQPVLSATRTTIGAQVALGKVDRAQPEL